jgi:hypothetical protein
VQAADARAAIAQAAALLDNEAARRAMSEAGPRFCAAHRGAAQRQLAVCLDVLRP